jgi:hypothetical protein
MKEGTVSRGVALRPRPTEVQPHFLGSNIYFGIFYESEVSRFIPTSVTILFLVLTRLYRLLLLSSSLFVTFIPTSVTKFSFVRHVYIDFCY